MVFTSDISIFHLAGLAASGAKDGMLMATLYAGSLIGMVHFISDLPGMGRWILGGRVPRYSPRYAWSFKPS